MYDQIGRRDTVLRTLQHDLSLGWAAAQTGGDDIALGIERTPDFQTVPQPNTIKPEISFSAHIVFELCERVDTYDKPQQRHRRRGHGLHIRLDMHTPTITTTEGDLLGHESTIGIQLAFDFQSDIQSEVSGS